MLFSRPRPETASWRRCPAASRPFLRITSRPAHKMAAGGAANGVAGGGARGVRGSRRALRWGAEVGGALREAVVEGRWGRGAPGAALPLASARAALRLCDSAALRAAGLLWIKARVSVLVLGRAVTARVVWGAPSVLRGALTRGCALTATFFLFEGEETAFLFLKSKRVLKLLSKM